MKLFLIVFVGCLCISLSQQSCEVKNVMMCYYGSWGVYRQGSGHIEVENIDPTICTHLVYSFAGLNLIENSIVSLDPWNDFAANGGKDSYKKFVQLKQKNPCLKTLLAIGGWNEYSRKYSVMASTQESRKYFANKVLRYITQYEFDGLDFDWEYPAARGGIVDDKSNFVELLKEIKNAFKPWGYMLTIAVGATMDIMKNGYDVKAISDTVDYVNIMAYDYTSSDSKTTGLLAPLKSKDGNDKTYTIDSTVKYWLQNNCDPKKIVIGIPTYARTFKLKDSNKNGIGAETVPHKMAGASTKEVGFLGYYELLQIFDAWDYKVYETAYTNNYATNGTYWMTYDSEKTVAEKVKYTLDKGLAGVMIWSLDTDDFQGIYSDDTYPLLRAIHKALLG